MDLQAYSPVRYVNWKLNGEAITASNSQLLISSSGDHHLQGVYYIDGTPDTIETVFNALPPQNNCQAVIKTSKGDIVVELSSLAPRHADHFEDLVESGYYDSLPFHRIIPGFVVQGGDGNQSTKKVDRRPPSLRELNPEFNNELNHYKGAIAMARLPDDINPDKRSSPDQFYLVHGSEVDHQKLEDLSADQGRIYTSDQRKKYLKLGGAPQLDGEYTVFGYMTMGFDVLDSLAFSPTGPNDYPLDTLLMKIQMVQ